MRAARLLHSENLFRFAASRAYYAMFYVAQAFLEGEGVSYSKHSAVIAGFAERFVRTGKVPRDFHRRLLDAMNLRHRADYPLGETVTAEQALEQMERAAEFLAAGERLIGDPRGASGAPG